LKRYGFRKIVCLIKM